MTPQELKNSILQLAIQGRLVEQRPEEGTAEELYRQIQREKKEQGIKANKKLQPIMDGDIPFDIPDTWMWVKFGDIVSYNMGKTPPRAESQWWTSDFPWVSIADMPENGHIVTTKEKVSFSALKVKFANKVSPAGTLLMSFKLTVGRVSILDINAVHNEAIISIYPLCDSESIIQSYLFYILPYVTQFGESKNAIKGKTLNDTSICNLLISLPPLAEQKRIVAKIEELLPYIDRYEKAWSRLEDFNKRFPTDMQKSILQLAIQGKLVPQRPEEGTGEELYRKVKEQREYLEKNRKIKKQPVDIVGEDVPFDIPSSWKWVRIGSIEEINLGFTYRPEYVNEGVYFLSVKDISDGRICFENAKKVSEDTYNSAAYGSKPQRGDILFGRVGTMGKPQIVDTDIPFCIFVSLGFFRDHLNVVDKKYVVYWMQTNCFDDQVASNVKGSAQKNLNTGWLKNFYFPLPPLAEQKRIVAKLEELLPLCERLK